MIICVKGKNEILRSRKMDIYVQKNKIMYTFLVFILFTFASCASNRPLATTHTERIEQHVMPVAVGADTIEIVLSHTDNILHTERTDNTEYAVATPAEDRYKLDADTACRVPTIESVRSTRALSITKTMTDTTSMLRITLRPDTVFVPYTHHIRSDTIVVPDRICKTKLQKTQTANVLLILILIAIFIYSLRS
jgi:hypothetical protein